MNAPLIYLQHWINTGTQEAEQFGLYVRLVCMKRNISVDELAKLATIPKEMVIAIRSDLISPDTIPQEVLERIEKSLRISYQRFLQINQKVVDALIEERKSEDESEGPASQVSPSLFEHNSIS
jgi:hypothetical protein